MFLSADPVMRRPAPGEFEQMMRLAVLRLTGDVDGVSIGDEIQARTRRDVGR
jgi:hypothetical protein